MSATQLTSLAMMAVGAAAVLAAAVLGWSGFPPSHASAGVAERYVIPEALGVADGPLDELTDEVDPLARFETTDTAAAVAGAAGLAAPAKKKLAKKPRPRPASSRTSGRSGSRGSSRPAPSKGWKSARCSWYGPGFYGNRMANGQRLKKNSMVVAHKSMPFGTRIEFKYRGRTVIATVKDRGPYVHGRVFDLGPGTAKALGFSGVGTVKYRIL